MEAQSKILTAEKLFDLSPEAIVLLNPKGKVLEVNQRLYDWLGYEPSEIIGKTLLKLPFFPPRSKIKVMRKFLARISGKKVEPYKLDFFSKSGEIKVGLIRAIIVKDEEDKPIADLVMVSEFTKEDTYEKELEKYKTIIENVDDLVMIKNRKGEFVLANNALLQFIAKPKEEVIGKKDEDLFDAEFVLFDVNKDLEESIDDEINVELNDKEYTFLTTTIPISLQDEKSKGYVRICRDITKQKELSSKVNFLAEFEELLANTSKEFINLPSEEMDTGINLLLSRIGSFLGADRAYLFLIDYDKNAMSNTHEWISKNTVSAKEKSQYLSLENFESFFKALKSNGFFIVEDSDELVEEEYNTLKATLKEQNVKSMISVGVSIGLRLVGFIGIDSVEKKQSFDNKVVQMLQLAGDMISNLMERKEISDSKNDFVSIASHQLRTPLTGINWNMEMILDFEKTAFTQDQKKIMNNVLDSSKRMVTLVNALLNVSRLESGRMSFHSKEVDLNELASEVIKELKKEIQDRKLTIQINSKKDKRVNADADLIREAMRNLVTNAIKYSFENTKIQIDITYNKQDAIFSITNEGIGIPKHQKNYLFTKFFRADNATKQSSDGTGLGLYFAKLIIDAHKGEISFESEVNKKTTFTFKIPIVSFESKEGAVRLSEVKDFNG